MSTITTTQSAIRHLLSAATNAALYGPSHPQVTRLAAQLEATLRELLPPGGELSLVVIDDELVVDGQPQETSLFLERFAQMLKSCGVGHVRIIAGITRQELDGLIAGLAGQGKGQLTSGEHLRLGRVEVRLGGKGEEASGRPRVRLPEMPAREMAQFMEIYESVKKRRKLKMTGIVEVVSGFVEAFRQEGRPLLVMAALREADEYTFTHSTNVCILNLAQAMSLGIEGQLLSDIGVAAMLHDIGKLFIPEEIITKKDKLSDEEFAIMRQHPVKGARYLLQTPGVPRLAIAAAYEHHLKYDFTGYPRVPAGWQQNLCSHMTMISDVFDALRTRRSYREPLEMPVVSNILLELMGKDLHPLLTSNFLRIIARLETG